MERVMQRAIQKVIQRVIQKVMRAVREDAGINADRGGSLQGLWKGFQSTV